MIDIRLIRENPELVRENIRKKFQDAKLPLVDEVIAAMGEVGRRMPVEFRETALGGLAATPTGERLKRELTAKREKQ